MRGRLLLGGARARHISSRCGRLHVLELEGRGHLPPLVLLHGFSATAATQFTGVMRALRRHFSRIIAPDLPGHGESSRRNLSPTVMVEGVVDVLDQVVEEPALVFASSLSGAVAVRATNLRQRRVKGLMLCSPSGAPVPEAELAELLATLRIESHEQALAFLDRVFVDAGPAAVRHVVAFGVRQQFGRPHLVKLMSRVTPADFLRPEELAALRMPVTLVWGGQERLLSVGQREFWRAHLPAGSRVETPPHYGHTPFLEHPDDLAARILRFAREVERAARPRAGHLATVHPLPTARAERHSVAPLAQAAR
ncbi:MAG: alpha/beta hydrolase [Polyangiaceae bacterium]|nr:alpha/beta hydrolase [Polyangiaceae bacterium]